jgi:hypothetical protein
MVLSIEYYKTLIGCFSIYYFREETNNPMK